MESSVISIVPFKIGPEEKPGLYPGMFSINPSKNDIPEIIHVGPSIYYIEIDVDRSVPVDVPSYEIARSIVDDYVSSQLGVSPESIDNRGPGIFWKHGKLELANVYKECKVELEKAKLRQTNWFEDMIRIADDDWEKTRQHRAITDMQRYACKALGLERPWSIKLQDIKSIKCPACNNILDPNIVVCPSCKCIINMEKYKTLSFAKAI